jgi:transcription elongation factor GreA
MKKNKSYKNDYLLEEELPQLKKQLEQKINELKMARLNGDYKENTDQKNLEAKVAILNFQISEKKKKVLTEKLKSDKTKVTYQLLETGEKETVELVSEPEINHQLGKVSLSSPLGLALEGKKVNEVAEVKNEK